MEFYNDACLNYKNLDVKKGYEIVESLRTMTSENLFLMMQTDGFAHIVLS